MTTPLHDRKFHLPICLGTTCPGNYRHLTKNTIHKEFARCFCKENCNLKATDHKIENGKWVFQRTRP